MRVVSPRPPVSSTRFLFVVIIFGPTRLRFFFSPTSWVAGFASRTPTPDFPDGFRRRVFIPPAFSFGPALHPTFISIGHQFLALSERDSSSCDFSSPDSPMLPDGANLGSTTRSSLSSAWGSLGGVGLFLVVFKTPTGAIFGPFRRSIFPLAVASGI